MGAFEALVTGMAEASIAFDCPITGGNVSFYNESHGRSIEPTPVILAVGEVANVACLAHSGFMAEGDVIGLLGPEAVTLSGSRFAAPRGHPFDGPLVKADPIIHKAVCDLLIRGIEAGLVRTAHDVAEGGLLGALAQCVIRSPSLLGGCLELSWNKGDLATTLFGEGPSRVVVAARPDCQSLLSNMADGAGILLRWFGTVVPDRFELRPYIACRVSDLVERFRQPIG